MHDHEKRETRLLQILEDLAGLSNKPLKRKGLHVVSDGA
jgi:hypothetical protein